MKSFLTAFCQKRRGSSSKGTRSLFLLLPLLFLLLNPTHARAFDLQFLGNFDYIPGSSPLQNSSPFGYGGGIRMSWEYLPDWDITATIMSEFFQTTQTIPINPVTYYPNNSGLVSITPVTVGIYHILYRTKAKNYLYAVGDVGSALEYSFGGGHITFEPYGDLGAGWSFKQWFMEERFAYIPQAFPAYPGPGFSGGPLFFITTSVGVHFFVF